MADDLGIGIDTSVVLQQTQAVVNQIFIGIAIGVFVLAIAGLIWFVLEQRKKNIKFRLRKVTSGGKTTIIDTRAAEVKDGDGNLMWKLSYRGLRVPIPPEDAIDTDSKGKRVVEAYLFATDQIVYVNDTPKTKIIPQEIFNITDKARRNELMREWIKENKVTYPLEPFTTNQRSILINQIHKAQTRKRFKWQDHVPVMVSVTALVILIFGLFIFWGDIAKPVLDSKQMTVEIVKTMQEIQNTNLQIKNDIQVIKSNDVDGRPTG